MSSQYNPSQVKTSQAKTSQAETSQAETSQDRLNRAKELHSQVSSKEGINQLLSVMQALRDPEGGCPWDLQQNYQSILPFTIEEVYEVAEAIETRDYLSLKDELGDLLFQIVFYAQLAREEGRFDFAAVVENICDKLIRRHPHVFSGASYQDEKQLSMAWEEQKQQERNQKSIERNTTDLAAGNSVLDDLPKVLPELKRAQKIQKRVAKQGFDWPDVSHVWKKVEEESLETRQASELNDKNLLEEELGDLLFSVVNLSRHYDVDADMALRKANQKFEKRFRHVERITEKSLSDCNLDELEALWQQAKNEA